MAVLSFMSDRSVIQTVDGREQKFYPISVRSITRLKSVSKAVAKALQTLFGGGASDQSKKSSETAEGSENGAFQKNLQVDAIDPRLAEMRHAHKQKAIEELIDTLLSEEGGFLLVDIVVDSLRDAGFPKPMSTSDKAAFIDTTSASCMVELLMGVAAANKTLFSPLAKWVGGSLEGLKQRLTAVPPVPASETRTTVSGPA